MSGRDAPDPAEGAPPATGYRGLQAAVARWLRVPEEPPSIPPGSHAWTRSVRPAEAFLRYLQLGHWLGVTLFGLPAVGGALLVTGAAMAADLPLLGVAALVLFAGLLGTWATFGHYALRLRFDTTWYVMTDRAIRIRRGIWTIREVTVTIENAQNVRIRQGPVQRWLNIGDVMLETAAAVPGGQQQGAATGSRAVIEGVADPRVVRDRIVERMRASRSTGLGDEAESVPADGRPGPAGVGPSARGWTPAHLQLLREIREEVARLGKTALG